MLGDSKQASSATTSLIYLTLGGLIDVWAIVYYFYLRNNGGTETAYLYAYGFIFTGIVLFLIGLAVGRIGYSARSAEVAPTPTQQVVTAPPMALAPPATATADPNPQPAQMPIARPASVVTPGAGTPADSPALSEKAI
ncbi:MAG: hypothetical protein AABP62_23890 [Planctomycetota bacterium]